MIPCDCCPTLVERCVRLLAPAFSRNLGAPGRTPGPGTSTFTFLNFAGSGVDVAVGSNGGNNSGSLGLSGGASNLAAGINGAVPSISHINVAFSQPVHLRRMGFSDLDSNAQEQVSDFDPQLSGVDGQHALFTGYGVCPTASLPAKNPLGVVRGTALNAIGGVLFPAPLTSSLDFDICRQAGAGQFLDSLSFDVIDPHDVITLFKCEDGAIWYDTAGALVDPNNYEDC